MSGCRIHFIARKPANQMLVYCWPTIYDAGPALNQHWLYVLRLLADVYRDTHSRDDLGQ